MTFSPLGDSAVVLALGDVVDDAVAARVRAIAAEIERHPPAGVVDVVPAFASIAVYFEPGESRDFDTLCEELTALVARADAAVVTVPVRTVEVPVCYGGEFGPDLEVVAKHTGLSAAEVIAQHAAADYVVHAMGFSPGFPYLGGLPPALATPRRATPRPRVPAGSVGIGGAQTGIYPLETPGGWNLIGRTPLALFDVAREEPALLSAGDRVKFRAIEPEEFAREARATAPARPAAPDAGASDVNGPTHAIEVVRAGMFTTVQDLGRRGHRARGVPLSGAADTMALRLANLLVGNPEDAAGLEFTLAGPELAFAEDTLVALGGADFGALPRWRPVVVPAGTRLNLDHARGGCRGYLAIAGGVQVPPVLGSRSTYVRARLGGLDGRALREGDVLRAPVVHRRFREHWSIDERILPPYAAAPVLRVIAGAHAGQFDPGWIAATFTVSSHSDRMGVRLTGPAVTRLAGRELVSAPVAPGTVQVPPDGQPILLLTDAQTIGGYPRIAHVASVDLPLVAQLRPGDAVRFERITLEEAHDLSVARHRALALLRQGIAQKMA